MKKLFVIIFTLISLISYSQNKDTYFAWRITESVYQYFDTLGISRLESIDTCDCGFILESKVSYFAKKDEAYDSLLLNELADEDLIDLLINGYIKMLKTYNKPEIPGIYIDTDVVQIKNKFSIIRMKRKVRYRVSLNVGYKPNERKDK